MLNIMCFLSIKYAKLDEKSLNANEKETQTKHESFECSIYTLHSSIFNEFWIVTKMSYIQIINDNRTGAIMAAAAYHFISNRYTLIL